MIDLYSVIIVDDEMNIISGLRVIIDWERLGCQIVGTALNGVEGFDLAMRVKPDIIVTDIRMPYRDGLQMIAGLKAAACPAHFIILSGYSEFEYAKKGIELGVNYYILKPVEETELEESLGKVIAAIEAGRQSEAEVERLRKAADRNRESLRELVLRDIIDAGSENPESLRELLALIEFPVVDTHYLSLVIELATEGDWGEGPAERAAETIREVLGKSYRVDAFMYAPAQVAVILCHNGPVDRTDVTRKLYEIRYCLAGRGQGEVTIGAGSGQREIAGISKSFEEARYALSYQIIKGKNRVIGYDEIAKTPAYQGSISQEDISRLEAGIESGAVENCGAVIDDILRKLVVTPGIGLPDIQLQCLNILLAGIRKMAPIPVQINEHLGKNLLSLEGIARFQTLEQLKQWLLEVIGSIMDLQSRHHLPVKKDLISDVKEYIAHNFEQNLSLAALAGRFFINPFYLSQLFKEKAGETYLNYVMRVRINKAKELLETTDLKIAEVCEAVGYTDAKYFSKLFEKLAGCKPSEYKSRVSRLP